MANLGQLVVNLEANIARFTSDMGRASQATEQAMNKIDGVVEFGKKALGALGVALSVDLIVSEINRSLDSLAALDDMAQKTGSSVETLSKLSKVAAFTGTDLGAVDGMLVKLSKNLNDVDEKGNKTAKALAAIGISTDDLKGNDPAQVFVDITNKLQGYEDGAGKVALVTDLMGKSAADMLPYMNDVAESIDQFTGDSAGAVAQAAALQDQIGLLRVKYDEFTTSIVTAALPAATAFVGALMDTKREANGLTKDTTVDTWADTVAIGLARIADRAKLTIGTLGALSGSVKVIATDILTVASLSPANIAVQVAQGKNPLDDFRAMMVEREKIIAAANEKWDRLLSAPINAIEEGTIKRISEQKDAAGLAALGAMVGVNGISSSKTLKYSGSDPMPPKDPKAPKKEKDGWTADGAADRMVRAALDETLAIQGTIDVTEVLQLADQKRADAHVRAMDQNAASVERIRQDLMTDVEHEQLVYESRMDQLRVFHDSKYENELQANALIEQEKARHEAAIVDMERQSAAQRQQLNMQVMQQAGGVADQMYSMLQQAGLQQTALGKAAFLASKAIAVAQIIMSTNVAAAAALAPPPLGLGPIAGVGMAGTIKALGYSSAAMTAGLAIASAEGGFDIPGGVNPVTQLHEKEMVLPKAQAEVIRGLARNGGASGGPINHTVNITIDGKTDMAENRKMIATAVQQGNADLVDRLSRSGRM